MELTNDLTPQQWALAQYLEDIFYEDERTVVTKEMICGNFPETYSRLSEATTEYNSTAYRKIRQDINAIKKSKCWHHVLITEGNHGYKIATLEEAKKSLSKEKKRAWNIYKRILVMKSCINAENQAYIDFENEEIKFNHFFD